MAEIPAVATDSAPEEDKGVKSDSPPDEGVKSDSPAGTDVEGSSTDDGKDKKPIPSLKEEIESAFAEEKGEAPKKEEPKKEEPKKDPKGKPETSERPDDGQDTDPLKVPEGIKEGSKAHERFQNLANTNKELTSKAEELDSYVTGMRGMVNDAGLNKEGFRDLLDFAREANSGDPKKALELLDVQRKELLLKIGEVVEAPGVLDDFPDLKEKVENHDLSEADAIKLAQAEVFKKQADQVNKTQADQQAEETNYKAAVQKYSAEVTALEAEWKKNDVDYSSKSAIIYEKLNDIQKQPPEQWPFLVKQAYDLITSAVKKSGKGLSSDTAVTKEHGGDGGQQEPKTRLEAISLALERGF